MNEYVAAYLAAVESAVNGDYKSLSLALERLEDAAVNSDIDRTVFFDDLSDIDHEVDRRSDG